MIEDWSIRLHSVDADGSCFFSSIAMALNGSLHIWKDNHKIRNLLRDYWHGFLELGVESPDNFTPTFVRYMTSVSIDQADLNAYNEIASADDKPAFDCLIDMAEHVLFTNCWVDTVTFGAFLKSLGCSIAVVVIDEAITEPLSVPEDLTRNKDLYICLWLQDDHYRPIQLVHKGRDLAMCVSRQSILQFMKDCYPVHHSRF